jgi:hypothetical protein
MKSFLPPAILAAIFALAGCPKDDAPSPSASASAKSAATTPAPSAGATASATSAATSTAAPAGGGEKITVKAVFPEYDGDYDGSAAVAWKYPSGDLLEIKLGRDCALTCELFDSDAQKAACPKGFILSLKAEQVKEGKQKLKPGLLGLGESSTSSLREGELEIKKLTDTEVVGTFTLPDNEETAANGSFRAKICNAGQ